MLAAQHHNLVDRSCKRMFGLRASIYKLQGFSYTQAWPTLYACRLAQANKDMAELNSRLVDAAFGNAFAASLSDNITPSASGLDREDSSNQFDRDSNNHLDRDSSNPAASSSGEQNSIMGLPPGVPLDLFYDE